MTPVPKPTPTVHQPQRIPAYRRNMVLARDRTICRWCKVPGGALDLHHVRRRSQGGTDDQANLVSVHRLCHGYIHEHPTEAKARGFLA